MLNRRLVDSKVTKKPYFHLDSQTDMSHIALALGRWSFNRTLVSGQWNKRRLKSQFQEELNVELKQAGNVTEEGVAEVGPQLRKVISFKTRTSQVEYFSVHICKNRTKLA